MGTVLMGLVLVGRVGGERKAVELATRRKRRGSRRVIRARVVAWVCLGFGEWVVVVLVAALVVLKRGRRALAAGVRAGLLRSSTVPCI